MAGSGTLRWTFRKEEAMALLDQVTSGREKRPRRIMLYGVQGIGKSTWAAQAPAPVFVQTEDGLGDIDTTKFPVATTFDDVMGSISSLYTERHSYQTVVVDSLDWMERLIWAEVCKEQNVKSIDAIGYGKGFGFALSHWNDFLPGISALRDDKGMMAILIAHSKIERFEDPTSDAYDRYSPRIHKTAAHLIQEWADESLFAHHRVLTRQAGDGLHKKTKGIGTGERIISTQEQAAHQAKNRLNLPPELPLEWEAYAQFLNGIKVKKAANGGQKGKV